MAKNKFNMPRTVVDAIFELPTAAGRVRMWHAICNFALDDKMPDFSGEELALFEKLQAEVKAINGGKRNGKK